MLIIPVLIGSVSLLEVFKVLDNVICMIKLNICLACEKSYIINNRGPRIEPCGTAIDKFSDQTFLQFLPCCTVFCLF